MEKRGRIRISLFARMSLLFGLLVTVPLVISGIVLSMAAWNSLYHSQSEIAKSGADVVAETAVGFRNAAEDHLKRAADDVAALGRERLKETSQKTVDAGTEAFKRNTGQMKQYGQTAVGKATQRMTQTAESKLDTSIDELQELNRKALNLLGANFSVRMSEALKDSASPVRMKLEQSLLEAWRQTADRRVTSVRDVADGNVSEINRALRVPVRVQQVVRLNAEAGPFLERYVRRNMINEIVRVVLISPTGDEIAHIPETEKEEDWAETETLKRVQASPMESLTEPLRYDDRSKKWIKRVVHKIPAELVGNRIISGDAAMAMVDENPTPQPTPFIVVDCQYDSLVGQVTGAVVPNGMQLYVIHAETGQVVSAQDRTKTNFLAQKILDQLPKGEEAEQFQRKSRIFTYSTGGAESVLMQGSAKFWPEDNCWVVVVQPDAEVRQPALELSNNIQDAGNEALKNVQGVNTAFIEGQVAEAKRRSEDAKKSAKEEMHRVEGLLNAEMEAGLNASQTAVIRQLKLELAETVKVLRERAGADMDVKAKSAASKAMAKVDRGAGISTDAAKGKIADQAGSIARQAAKQMLLNSAWLIPLFLVLALFLATMTSRSLVRPIDRLVKGTQLLAAGEYNQRISIRGDDELARLAVSFNDMADAIAHGQAALQQSHDSLAAEKARIEAIIDASPDGLVMVEPDGQVALINQTALGILGLRPNEVPSRGSDLSELPDHAASRLRECLERVQGAEGMLVHEFTEPYRLVLQLREVTVRSASGSRHGRLVHLHDITRERVIDEMKSDFISLVSHELRTPLTSILGFSSYMLTGKMGQVADNQKTALESIHRQAKRLSAIISDFLDVSRIESGKIEMKKEPIQVLQIAGRVMEDLRPQANEKSIRVEARSESNEPMIALGDEQRVAQVLTNLVGNALKFTEREGAIDVVLSRQNGSVLCRVKDTGCGIPPDELDRVFDRFYQVEKVVTRKSGGTGLGLAIVKNIVEAHGGQIWIESELGQGTQVSFTLPAST